MSEIKDLKELEKEFESMTPEQEIKLFLKDRSTFQEHAEKLIPELYEIHSVLIGVIRSIDGDDVRVTLGGLDESGKKLVGTERVFEKSYATKYGKIEEGLPVAFVVYRTKGSEGYEGAFIPWDVNAPKSWISLKSGFDYSRFS